LPRLLLQRSIEPENLAIAEKIAWAEGRRKAGLPTVPSTIGAELQHNVFMRCELPAVQNLVSSPDAVSTIRELRARKDSF
jgi:hydroxyacylglutathione hydrolase